MKGPDPWEFRDIRQTHRVHSKTAMILVAATSGLILVLEIVAGRLMAPYVGVSLDTFTGIIGTILAGIAIGAAVGGALADKRDPIRLIAQALFYGGALTWLSIPIVTSLGPGVGSGPVAIVVLAASGFVLPTAVLSGIGPMVAKLQLDSLEDSGSVVGRLSAASTFGALLGTFGVGFVLIALLPVRTIIVAIGALLVVSGLVMFWRSGKKRPDAVEIGLVALAAQAGEVATQPQQIDLGHRARRQQRLGDGQLLLHKIKRPASLLATRAHFIELLFALIELLPRNRQLRLHLGTG